MDSAQDRRSAIPRLSRLPVPRPTSSLPRPANNLAAPSSVRRAPSGEKLGAAAGAAWDLQPQKLRQAASRGSLRSSSIHVDGRPSASQSTSREQKRLSTTRLASSARPKTQPPVPRPKVAATNPAQRRTSAIIDKLDAPRAASSQASSLSKPLASEVDGSSDDKSDDNDVPGILPPGEAPFATPRVARSKQSLVERTVETLAQLPSSPAMSKRPSSFYDKSQSRSRAGSGNSRPSSSYNSDGSNRTAPLHGSRPVSRAGQEEPTASGLRSPSLAPKPSLTSLSRAPAKISITTPLCTGRNSMSTVKPGAATLADAKSPSLRKPSERTAIKSGAKTVVDKPATPRTAVKGLFRKPSLPAMRTTNKPGGLSSRRSPDPNSVAQSSWDEPVPPLGTKPTLTEQKGSATLSSRKSSSALREQIAKAKAAKRAAIQQVPEDQVMSADRAPSIAPSEDGFDFETGIEDPFNLQRGQNPGTKVLKQRVATARTTGRLNIAALGLKEIPAEVLKMYDLESIGTHDGSWAESVDLTRLVAADNEIEMLDDAVFPDTDPDTLTADEDSSGNIFAGLETLDLHGNLLTTVPLGFRRLLHLTSLNLSSNRLDNDCMDVVSQMTAIKDLKLSKNNISGSLSSALTKLEALEMLDVHGNNITALPDDFEQLSRLRILNLSENKLETIPFDGIAKLPLTELVLRKNRLTGTLIRDAVQSLPQLQLLDASSNQLTRLVDSETSISLPATHTVSLSMNRLQELPDMTSWISLSTLGVDENNISVIPRSFMTLERLRHADFSSNDIRVVPPEIANMTTLTMLRLTGNPLRDKKFATATTEELKEILAARLEPPPPYQEPVQMATMNDFVGRLVEVDNKTKSNSSSVFVVENVEGESRSDADDDFATPPTSAPHSPRQMPFSPAAEAPDHIDVATLEVWPVKPGGLLDRSRAAATELSMTMCAEVATRHQVRQAQLHHNLFVCMPSSLSAFGATLSSLSLAHNQLAGDTFLTEELSLPALKEINLASNLITDLGPLIKYLRAPALDKMDVSMNRIKSLPEGLRQAFPQLTVLLASSNQLSDLEPSTIAGLRTVDASNNDIAHLNPRIGLLGGQGGLQRLEVTGNRFKVPRWNILERGTDATLRWLRGRMPADEMAAWREENGDESADDLD
ncbi:hypothetical protein HIM_05117 [Hirsutella minnesotensis 3608]|uniref:Leucine-rich repeat-containing protein 40 n=1 Tax=Hirsutella minnesotensis 3608 TaxID=1043627 RepID=A0A0F7ZKM9_9HYPO|nr:hypothetical protein HIM_05117 [Hirsutella minnesotensis 3608]